MLKNEQLSRAGELGIKMWQTLAEPFARSGMDSGITSQEDIEKMFTGFLAGISGSMVAGFGKERSILILNSVMTSIEQQPFDELKTRQ